MKKLDWFSDLFQTVFHTADFVSNTYSVEYLSRSDHKDGVSLTATLTGADMFIHKGTINIVLV